MIIMLLFYVVVFRFSSFFCFSYLWYVYVCMFMKFLGFVVLFMAITLAHLREGFSFLILGRNVFAGLWQVSLGYLAWL